MTDPAEISAVVAAARSIPPENFEGFAGVWPGEISTALVDAVYSGGRDSNPQVDEFREQHPDVRDDLRALVELGDTPLLELLGTNRTVQGRRPKAEAIIEVAGKLVDAGIVHAADIADVRTAQLRDLYVPVEGLGKTISSTSASTWAAPAARRTACSPRSSATPSTGRSPAPRRTTW